MSTFKKTAIWVLVTLTLILSGCEADKAERKTELTISAAASLRDALEEAGQLYMKENPDIHLIFNFGGSGSLQQQITQGAPVDLFISAAEDKFSMLLDEGKIDMKHSVKLLANELTLITPNGKQAISSLEDLLNPEVKRIAIGTPESVPAGMYAKQTFISAAMWDQLEYKIIYTKDVRQVLSYVETGNVDGGIVYKTDALISDKVSTVTIDTQDMHDPIIYPSGVVAASKNRKEAASFLAFLQEQAAREIFIKYGFQAALD